MDARIDNGVGGFKLLASIKAGSGAQGNVYKAVCERDDLPLCPRGTVVALKSMPVTGTDADHAFERLQARTQALSAIDHPNIVRYLGCFAAQLEFADRHFIVQEYLEGVTLAEKLRHCRGGLDADEALRVVKGMVAGLAGAAAKGIVHRDVKPGNVFLCSNGTVKLIDFEISRQNGGAQTSSTGNMVGSFDYMAPDFTDSNFSGDEQSDIFSAGVVMHEVFSGETPYKRMGVDSGNSSFEFLGRWTRDANGQFAKGACRVASSIERIVAHAKPVLLKALALRREDRFRTFNEFLAALGGIRMRELRNGVHRYRILQLVGRGGFGEVFKAKCEGRFYAVKHLLKLQYATRFFREAKIMSELTDPCFVQFFDFFVLDHSGEREAFLVMDYLPGMPGSSLRDAIRKSNGAGIDFETAVKAFIRYAHALKIIHERGIYHRDIKPTNLYFPADEPEKSAVMDLGIARDENGTETSGQVPGTLDYMPPETALGEARGDAGMDIYALGLCLYEALTGKKGYPKLPTGSAALAQFFQRSKDKVPPDFSDERVMARPELLELLLAMTDPEPKRRLADATAVERALRRLIGCEDAPETAVNTQDVTSAGFTQTLATGLAEDVSDTGDDDTVETVFVEQSEVMKKVSGKSGQKKKKEKKPKKGTPIDPKQLKFFGYAVVFGCVLGAVSSLVYFNRETLDGWLDKLVWQPLAFEGKDRIHETSTISEGLGLGIEDYYGDDSIPIEKADEMCKKYMAERRPPVMAADEYARLVSLLESRREQRVLRESMSGNRNIFDNEVKLVEHVYENEGLVAGDAKRDAWRKTWANAPKFKRELAERQLEEARNERIGWEAAKALLPEAEAAAAKVIAGYTPSGIRIADRDTEVWKNAWRDRITSEDFSRLLGEIAVARSKVEESISTEERVRAGKALVDECRALLDMVSPVQSRMSRLSEAEIRLRAGFESGLVEAGAMQEVKREIAARRKWTVFEVINCSNLDLAIDDLTLRNGESHTFIYTNAPPADLAATCLGYEPFPLGRQNNGHSVRLLPEYFELLKVAVDTGVFQDGVVCRVDGVPVRAGTIHIVPGSHECVYSKADYKDQALPFRVEPATPTRLPAPGIWTRSEDFNLRERNKGANAALAAAELAIQNGDWDRAKSLADNVSTALGGEIFERKRALIDKIDRHFKTLARTDEAALAYMEDNWVRVVDIYHDLHQDGYKFSEEDAKRVKNSVKNARSALELQKLIAERRGSETVKRQAREALEDFEKKARNLE